jgi:hypothetical protein
MIPCVEIARAGTLPTMEGSSMSVKVPDIQKQVAENRELLAGQEVARRERTALAAQARKTLQHAQTLIRKAAAAS